MTTLYEILRRPIITEKSTYQSSKLNQFAFEVARTATKAQIKEAVQVLFEVKVIRVNVMNIPAKRGLRGRGRRRVVRRAAYKKALVTLAEGQTIDVFEGVS